MTKREQRACLCANMREGCICGSTREGASSENRRCFILFPRKQWMPDEEEEVLLDYCPFKGIYGWHVAKEAAKEGGVA